MMPRHREEQDLTMSYEHNDIESLILTEECCVCSDNQVLTKEKVIVHTNVFK